MYEWCKVEYPYVKYYSHTPDLNNTCECLPSAKKPIHLKRRMVTITLLVPIKITIRTTFITNHLLHNSHWCSCITTVITPVSYCTAASIVTKACLENNNPEKWLLQLFVCIIAVKVGHTSSRLLRNTYQTYQKLYLTSDSLYKRWLDDIVTMVFQL